MFSATLREWKRKIEQLRQRWRAVRQENERLRKENEVLRRREKQWEREIVRKPIWRRFDIDIGHCEKCHKRVQGRDSRQTSDALGAAKVQLGPEALALAVRMNKDLAMPHADVAAVLRDGFQLQVNRSTIARAVDRVARRGALVWL